jgi:hypothetical protein
MVHGNAALGKQFLHLAVGKTETQLPANRTENDLGLEMPPLEHDRSLVHGVPSAYQPGVDFLQHNRGTSALMGDASWYAVRMEAQSLASAGTLNLLRRGIAEQAQNPRPRASSGAFAVLTATG